MAGLHLNKNQIKRVKRLARDIADHVTSFIDGYSTVSVERAVLRLYGVDGVDDDGIPLCNRIVDILRQSGALKNGVSRPFATFMLATNRDVQATARLIAQGHIDAENLPALLPQDIITQERQLVRNALHVLDESRRRKQVKQKRYALPPQPWRYIIVATGNIYEDRTQAKAAVSAGADIIAVIRSTAQSLLDYIPYGPTTEGFGGTFATQKNFKIMRDALDEMSAKVGRFIRLVNYASGLCMAEIAACAAFEDLDILLNDAMYGILFRDINMKRTFIDQYFSRLICGRARILINTGEDNYLTTSDAIENAYTVTASQLINEATAKNAFLSDDLLGLGHAFEIDPNIANAFLYELAQAQLTRELFPNAPIKYMPPTKFKSTDIFLSHCMDALFNLASIMTHQGIHLSGILTEAIHTPFMQDRYAALRNIDYVFKIAKDLGSEIEFKKDGFIQKRARQVLRETEEFLKHIREISLIEAIAHGKFAGISRKPDSGKGLTGVFEKGSDYSNPLMEALEKDGKRYISS